MEHIVKDIQKGTDMKNINYEKEICANAIGSAYDKGYADGYDEGKGQKWNEESLKAESEMYAKGLKDAWECAIHCLELGYGKDILRQYSVTDVMDKIKEINDEQTTY